MRLQQCDCRHDEADVVYGTDNTASVDAGWAQVDTDANCEEERVVDSLWDECWVLLGVKAAEGVKEGGGNGGGVLWGRLGGGQGSGTERVVVVHGGCGGPVVDRDGDVHEGGDGDEVGAGALVCGEQRVGGLAGGYEDCVRLEGLGVYGINFHYGQLVPRHLHKQILVECSIDYAQQVCLPALHLQPVPICTP